MTKPGTTLGRAFGWVWKIVTGIYRVLIVVAILVSLGMLWFSLSGGPAPTVDDNVALVIKPFGTLVDETSSPAQRLVEQLSGETPTQTSLRTLREALRHAATDSRIKLAVLDVDEMGDAGVAQLQELSRSLAAFRASGKKLYAFGTQYDQYQYLPAVQADSISVDPMGGVLLQGFAVYGDYFKDALDKLGVEVNVFRVGEFKSAVEPFLRNDMSEAAKLANRAWLGDLWNAYQTDVTARRKLPADALDRYIANFAPALTAQGGDGAQVALAAKLVDKIQTRDAFRAEIGKLVGKDKDIGSFRQISAATYLSAWQHEHKPAKEAKRIALVVVQGAIVDGQSGRDSAGGDTIAGLLDDAARDKSVAAVVLRVNSPGGSVTAAEKIRRATLRVKAAGKPLVVSMSTMAASGGYWISMDADEIFAEPTTITGSIGIFGVLPNLTKPLNKLGVYSDGVGTSPLAGAFRVDRPLTAAEREIIQSQINYGYTLFTAGVARGRKLPLATVQNIAQGRVWSGQAAKKLGLVDAFGGLHAALEAAAQRAKLAPGAYAVKRFSPAPSFMQLVKTRFDIHASSMLGVDVLPAAWRAPLQRAARLLEHFNDPRGAYAYCFCSIAAPAR
ncbi:MAG: signal peptide peptidase SppA [Nevskiaceae bacterium]|nr:MAG: signal peptide peptidase SppA [Nevskiaceae bacterium]TBR72269.1 MAG: signal peptide peptidase SppA [Nevskiaceae bacterium]